MDASVREARQERTAAASDLEPATALSVGTAGVGRSNAGTDQTAQRVMLCLSDRAGVPSLRKLFGARVRAGRAALGLSQEGFADVCKMHRTYIGQIERGERNVSIDSMERIAMVFGAELSDMLERARPAPGPAC